MGFMQDLHGAWRRNDSLVCVGLDPEPAKFPARFRDDPDAVFGFCRAIVDATADLVCAFKPQIAHFAALGAEDALQRLIAHIHARRAGPHRSRHASPHRARAGTGPGPRREGNSLHRNHRRVRTRRAAGSCTHLKQLRPFRSARLAPAASRHPARRASAVPGARARSSWPARGATSDRAADCRARACRPRR